MPELIPANCLRPIDELTEVHPTHVRAGDTIAYVFTGRGSKQAWCRCEVVANDDRARIIVVRCHDGRFDTLEWGTDSVARWRD